MTLEWNKCITEVLAEDLDRRPCRKIGGEGRIVEVDETVFAKHEHVSGKVVRSQWTVAGICRETGQSFLKMVPDRSANSFLDAIKENVSDGSIIYAYSWKGYKASQLEAAGFPQLTSNHRLNFVDPSTAEVAEELYDVVWGSDKWRSNHQTRSARQYQDSYLVEFVWRQEIGNTGLFEPLLEAIKRSAISNNGPDTSASPKQEELSSAAALLDVLGIPTVADEHHEVVIENYPEVCPDCDMGFGNITDLLVHANEMHEFKGVIKQEIFSSYSAFERWKEEMEKEHCTHWIRRGERAVHMVFYAHLRCRWPRTRVIKRKLKVTEALHKSCTSFMNVKRYLKTGVTSVEYCLEHFGHKKLPHRPPLPWSIKVKIAEMLTEGLQCAEIVRHFQVEDEDTPEWQHAVITRDVKGVAEELKSNPELFKTEEECTDPDLCFMSESSSTESSTPMGFCKEEPGSSTTTTIKAEPTVDESSMFKNSIKQEPGSTTSMSEPFTKIEPMDSSVEGEPPCNGGIRAFTLSVAPDGKGFALVDQPLV